MSDFQESSLAPDSAPSVLEARFERPGKLAAALAESIAADLRMAVEKRGRASLVVSGGSTPLLLFANLSSQSLPWDKLTITLADERWVAVDEEASNERLVRRHLLIQDVAAARFVSLKTSAATPEAGRAECEQRLQAIESPFDVVVLGMGGDGHTASIFPHMPGIEEALDLSTQHLCWPALAPSTPSARITLTLAALLRSRRCVLHITGEQKWRLYRKALTPGSNHELPVRAVLGAGKEPIDVYWAP